MPRQAEGRLNLIEIVVDTWGVHWMGCYGTTEVRTPSVDALARQSVMFMEAYAEALPTLPARRSLYTGRRVFPSDRVVQPDDGIWRWRGWHQLYAEDVTLSETLRDAGYTNALVTDVYHQFKPGKNFQRGFQSWRYIRGQESDALESGPRKAINLSAYVPSRWPEFETYQLEQYLMNRREWKTEEDWPAAQVFREAARWLDNNVEENQPFYLHIESFSPHEFWDPPEDYYRLYMKSDYQGPRLIAPPQRADRLSAVELEQVRALYAGLVTFVDSRLGKFLEKVEQLGLLGNTVIALVADHGTMQGEQGQIGKGEGRLRTQLTHVPLIIYHPSRAWARRRVAGYVLHTDLMPTLLDLLGVAIPSRVTGQSLRALMESGERSRREWIVTGFSDHGAIRTPEWLYVGRWNPGDAWEDLYDLRRDPLELNNVMGDHLDLVKEFRVRLKEYVDSGWGITRGGFTTVLL